jgi:hypothetical protein
MARYVFPSISGRKVGYVLQTDSMALWDQAYRTAQALGPQYAWFQTYGDGMTQHEPERVVTLRDAQDYFASLGEFMARRLEQPFEGDEARQLLWSWPTGPSRDRIEFALSIEHKPGGRPRYFTLHGGEFKVSAAERLQHDKRWHPVKEEHDGTVTGALAVMHAGKDRHDIKWLLERWVEREAVRAVAVERSGWARETAAVFMKDGDIEASSDDVRAMSAAFELAAAAFAALLARIELDIKVFNYRQRLPKAEAGEADGEVV